MVEEDLMKLREAYRIPTDIEVILSGPNERACFSRRGCTALHLNAFVSGMRLPLHPMLRRILRAYDLAPTQVTPNGWSQMVGGMYLWFRHSFSMEMPLHVFQTIYQPRNLLKIKGRKDEAGCRKSHGFGCPVIGRGCSTEPDLDVPNVYGIAKDTSQRKVTEDLSREENREAVEASKIIEVDDVLEGKVPLSRKRKVRASGTRTSQARGNAVEVVDNYTVCSAPSLQRTLAINTLGKVVLKGPSKSTQAPGGGDGGPYDSKKRFRELIGAPCARVPDDALRNLPFYPSMGA
ncbi:Uncharacterized protein Adt_46314 [Abeliophyllum distichum]|uniref:Transposase (putative) gypsy type domain-containing protein n=1 Tax=Abeliophyllum distichum TaxID=126358 RepID=A0ABD1P1N6_9LAMI